MEEVSEATGNLILNCEKNAEKKIKLRRRAIFISIITIFSVTALILVLSMHHEETNKYDTEFEVFDCQESDIECLQLICPAGWQWNNQSAECNIIKGDRFLDNVINHD